MGDKFLCRGLPEAFEDSTQNVKGSNTPLAKGPVNSQVCTDQRKGLSETFEDFAPVYWDPIRFGPFGLANQQQYIEVCLWPLKTLFL